MQNKVLFEQFKTLAKITTEDKNFAVIPIMDTNHKLGISKERYPKFFVCTNDTVSSIPNTTLDILSIEYNLSCTFVDDNDTKTPHHYTILTLRSVDQTLQEDFFDIVIMMFDRMPEIPSKARNRH